MPWLADGTGFSHAWQGMRFSLQLQYAISGIFDLAYNGHEGPTQIRVIGERQGIPMRYLEQIFQRLRRAGLVKAKRGPGGGYLLARDPAEISLVEVVEAIEGTIHGRAKGVRSEVREGSEAAGPEFLWPWLSKRFNDVLSDVTLAELCRMASREGVPRLDLAPQDYQI